ncbi:MAG TPA: Mu-like prophage major head subunit gpT family protein [Longimicrobium sp.]|jgi:phage major head subunit gpT-like protein
MLVNQDSLRALFTGFKGDFNKQFAATESMWERIAMLSPSTKSEERYDWLGSIPGFREWVGERVVNNLGSHGFTLRNIPFELTIGVKRENIEDDNIGVYKPAIEMMGMQAKQHPDTLVFSLVREGFRRKCFDGQFFFDTDHPVLAADRTEVSASNWQGGDGPLWILLDTTKPIKPFIFQRRKDYTFVPMDSPTDEQVFTRGEFRYGVDARGAAGFGLWQLAYGSRQPLTRETYEAAYAAMQSLKKDGGDPLGVRPDLLLVPAAYRSSALEITKAEKLDGSTNINRDSAEALVCPWLD